MRKIKNGDRNLYVELVTEFYNTNAVLHKIPEENINKAFDEIIKDTERLEGYFLEYNNQTVGYVLVLKYFSQELGGIVTLLDEVYVRESYRGLKIASTFVREYEELSKGNSVCIDVEISPDNPNAIKFWSRLGFNDRGYLRKTKTI